MDLVEAPVRVGDVLEHAARQYRVEAVVLERELDRIGAEVSLDLRKALERLDRRLVEPFAVVERDDLHPLGPEEGRNLPVAAAPVEHAAGVASREVAGELPVLEHLRAGAQVDVDRAGGLSCHGR